MATTAQQRQKTWQSILARLQDELEHLSVRERQWIGQRLAEIADLQQQLQGLFLAAGGEDDCEPCAGQCCARGSHHLTLANLLACFLDSAPLPKADFSRTCPLLGAEGCLLPAERRPFNCVTFFCEPIEARLLPAQRRQLAVLEQRLREVYLAFDRRYLGSSLRGLLIGAERLGARPFLQRR